MLLADSMSKSVFSDAHRALVETLTAVRKETGMHQSDVAAKIGKDQSFISNIERGQRRVDMVEFFAITKAMGLDSVAVFTRISDAMPKDIEI